MPRLPTSRIARTARFGRMVGGAAIKRNDPMAVADQLVTQLGQMKGAAMKFGQVLSTIDFDMVPEGEREAFKERLAELRDAAPAVPFPKMEKLLRTELGGPVGDVFAEFDPEPIAAASIGQVYRARTRSGADVAVEVQYPGVAEAVETDLRNMAMLFPLVRRLAPGLDVKALGGELRERISEELDYELEAQNQRRVARVFRGHPHVQVPGVDTRLSTRRVLVTEFVEGRGFAAVKRLPEPERDRFAEVVYRFFWGLLANERLVAGDPHPGNYLLAPDGRVCFLDFGLMRTIDRAYLDDERALAQARSPRPGRGSSSPASSASTPSSCARTWRRRGRRARPTSSTCGARRCRPRRCCCAGWRGCCSACSASCARGRTGGCSRGSTSRAI
ncbi:MAG: AarF/ABC1/UbiB kinase family protein, partial [Actinomycetota bacterium]|nr:AarF/ABC1/UbiB kinase family protein [Actinomycetota bacterium]